MYMPNLTLSFVVGLLSTYSSSALKRFLCRQYGPLRCEDGGVLYIRSVSCRSYSYAMQLLQENCSGRTACRRGIVPDVLSPRCCHSHKNSPYVIYQCISGSADAGPALDRALTEADGSDDHTKTFQKRSRGHPLRDQILIVSIFGAAILLWGSGLVFFQIRYKSEYCRRGRRRSGRTVTLEGERNPVYTSVDPPDSQRYVEIHHFPSPHYYTVPLPVQGCTPSVT